MNILVTGGCGFIGSTLIKILLKEKNNLVLNIDSLRQFSVPEALEEIKNYNNYQFKKIDICDFEKLKKIVFKFKPAKIFHLAAESHVDRSIQRPVDFINSNVIGTFNLLSIFKEYLSKKRSKDSKYIFLHVSTDEVYGSLTKHQRSFREDSNYSPNSPYSASKASSDMLARAWHVTYKLPIVITHSSNNYGSWQYPEKLIPLMIYKAYMNQKMPVYGNGQNIRDWIFVKDHARALIDISNKGKIGEIYNIGADQEIKNISLVKEICKIFDKKFPKKAQHSKLINFVEDRAGHDFRYSLNINKIKNNFQFKPKYNIKEGLELTVNWYLDNIDWMITKFKNSLT